MTGHLIGKSAKDPRLDVEIKREIECTSAVVIDPRFAGSVIALRVGDAKQRRHVTLV